MHSQVVKKKKGKEMVMPKVRIMDQNSLKKRVRYGEGRIYQKEKTEELQRRK